jgi:hypothetical protein
LTLQNGDPAGRSYKKSMTPFFSGVSKRHGR